MQRKAQREVISKARDAVIAEMKRSLQEAMTRKNINFTFSFFELSDLAEEELYKLQSEVF